VSETESEVKEGVENVEKERREKRKEYDEGVFRW